MSNKLKRNIAFVMTLLGVIILIWVALESVVNGRQFNFLQYLILPLQIAFFGVVCRNFSLAVKEDEKYGDIKKDK